MPSAFVRTVTAKPGPSAVGKWPIAAKTPSSSAIVKKISRLAAGRPISSKNCAVITDWLSPSATSRSGVARSVRFAAKVDGPSSSGMSTSLRPQPWKASSAPRRTAPRAPGLPLRTTESVLISPSLDPLVVYEIGKGDLESAGRRERLAGRDLAGIDSDLRNRGDDPLTGQEHAADGRGQIRVDQVDEGRLALRRVADHVDDRLRLDFTRIGGGVKANRVERAGDPMRHVDPFDAVAVRAEVAHLIALEPNMLQRAGRGHGRVLPVDVHEDGGVVVDPLADVGEQDDALGACLLAAGEPHDAGDLHEDTGLVLAGPVGDAPRHGRCDTHDAQQLQ